MMKEWKEKQKTDEEACVHVAKCHVVAQITFRGHFQRDFVRKCQISKPAPIF